MSTDLQGLNVYRTLVASALAMSASLAAAQGQPHGPSRPDPLDAQALVPTAQYRSPLSDYRPLGEDKPMPWRDANETVNRIGGWRAYGREALQPEASSHSPGVSSPKKP